ncbi:glycosyltransferase family 2 protein [Algoriphagus aquimarinus]|uniref:Glycosyltransferase involved in cell wall bisynthesis n=1 Tax=Algoriphagus aquimarinus TaxID=237018 RepID=A0A1I1AM45_9BACT|nr:glycosyltransferase family 2 protein [Algoriphagus aquimarinus]SFB37558.1 Glycosyltransferase involved in cell wall bisynthesis [Algoriphagus aquimarinus]
MKSPLISIIVATYNSSHVLRYAMQSVLDSDYQNWEMIVIGDCCTDDTEEMVLGFNDPRISFSNLEQNSGQQAKPTNVALGKVKGEYIAFLNQDDLYFKDHLSKCVVEIMQSQAEFMIVPGIKISPSTPQDLENNSFAAEMYAVHPRGKFSPHIFSIASTWFVHHSVPEKIGDWKMEKELFVTPSQEWLFRAHTKDIAFHFPQRAGVIIIHSAERKGFYTENNSFEHDYFFSRINDLAFKLSLLEKAAVKSSSDYNHQVFKNRNNPIRRMIASPFHRILKSFGIHPTTFRLYLKWKKRGKYIGHLKGIAEQPKEKEVNEKT